MERVHLFGIRHHGPGSSRSLIAALQALQPDALLIEGPPEADNLLQLALNQAMCPPVALLVYAVDDPTFSAYYPFADFSPEWQAIRYGMGSGAAVWMMDLPQAVQIAIAQQVELEEKRRRTTEAEAGLLVEYQEAVPADLPDSADGTIPADRPDPAGPAELPVFNSSDPLLMLAEAAGYSDSELWWDHLVEQRQNPADLFTAIQEAMTALREAAPAETNPIAVRREAAMRRRLRDTLAAGYQRIAVVCGAWHVPALVNLNGEKEDADLLKGLPRVKVEATWIPWTFSRLARQSGYGAGIDAPGWYNHLWKTESGISERWMIRAARLLRAEDLDVSPAAIIDAVRLAEALAALRGRPVPGLPELNEAALTALCFGNPLPMRLIEQKLVIGESLGSVPPETPQAPLVRDFEREVRRLRLPLEASEKMLDLDLRKPTDLERSHLLHRLNLLDVPWGSNSDAALQASGSGRSGTFHEIWRLNWRPELFILLIDSGQWGNTLDAAAAAKVCRQADTAASLAQLTGLVEDVLLADLPGAVEHVMGCLQAQAAISSDIPHLMDALPPLASVMRYGNVRQTGVEMLAQVIDGLAARVFIGLLGACAGLNDDAAGEMFARILKIEEVFARMDERRYQQEWQRALDRLSGTNTIHGLIAGRACRILLDGGLFSSAEAGRRLNLGLSTAAEPDQAAAWIDGFLRGSGQLLVHDHGLLSLIDSWLSSLPGEAFPRLLPLLRRTFSSFASPERRSIGESIRRSGGEVIGAPAESGAVDFDQDRADAVLPLLARLLGIQAGVGAILSIPEEHSGP